MKISPMPVRRDQLVDDVEHLRLHRDVERRGRLVGDQQVRLGDQHHGDHHALAHAARNLVRIELRDALGIVDAHRFQHRAHALGDVAAPELLVRQQRLGDLRADRHDRVEREFRVLHDHRDAGAANGAHLPFRKREQIDAVEGQAVGGDAARARGSA